MSAAPDLKPDIHAADRRSVSQLLARGLRSAAGWIVVFAWTLVLFAILMAFAIGLSTLIALASGFSSPDAPYKRALAYASLWAVGVGLLAAVVSSIAMLFRGRLFAALNVVATWAIFLIGATIYLAFVPLGSPAHQHSVGADRLMIPWQYGPAALSRGVSVRVCLDNLMEGPRGIACSDSLSSTALIIQLGTSIAATPEMQFFTKASQRITRTSGTDEHDGYIYTPPPNQTIDGAPINYFVRYGPGGQPVRLVNCQALLVCTHVAVVGTYVLTYAARRTELSNWETTDRRLAELVDSWRVK